MSSRLAKFIPLLVLIGLVFILAGCSRDERGRDAEKTQPSGGADQQNQAAVAPPEPKAVSIEGKVLEVLDSGSFVFILLDRGENQIWATVPAVEVEVGERITLLDANVFRRFHSKELDRTFEELIFSTGVKGKSEARRAAFGRGMREAETSQPAGSR
ncbi:MAG: hypothetical protein RQ753_00525 [Desulfurivibrionaceae bacterium]|nr:hypothetical protein [Desulfobulbales bacterium]MDT8334160.1 hypothetical protein [Desulfurivibrionaceae bacterium]